MNKTDTEVEKAPVDVEVRCVPFGETERAVAKTWPPGMTKPLHIHGLQGDLDAAKCRWG